MTAAFDPAHYKRTTRAQWEDAAAAWHGWGHVLEAWLAEATAAMLDGAGVRAGSRVLDVAAGAGGQSLAAARRGASVLATDLSAAILEHAAADAAREHLDVTVRELDGESLDVDPAAFDAVICRLGLIYLPDRRRALAGRSRRAGGSPPSSTRRRSATRSSPSRSRSSAGGRACPRQRPPSPGRSASARPARWRPS